jgi:3-oxoacyl-[acyl-carrier protein] reductase
MAPLLVDKVALVTGASRGLGRAVALELASRGADVIVNYRHSREAAATVVDAVEQKGRRAIAVQADVADFDQASELVNVALTQMGGLDILVNNAGITRDALLMRMEEEDWDAVMRVNLKGVFNVCKAAVRTFIRQRSGRIINISSVSGMLGQTGQTNYAASKAGLIGFTKSLARELGTRGITVNVVAPGFIPTDLNASLEEAWKTRLLDLIPLGHFGKPEDVAWVVAFLAGDEAAYITGAVLPVDGGLSM